MVMTWVKYLVITVLICYKLLFCLKKNSQVVKSKKKNPKEMDSG